MRRLIFAIACFTLSLGLAMAPLPAEAGKGGRGFASKPAAGKPAAPFQKRQAAQNPARPTPPTTSPGTAPAPQSDLRLGHVNRSSCGGKMVVLEADGTETVRCQRQR